LNFTGSLTWTQLEEQITSLFTQSCDSSQSGKVHTLFCAFLWINASALAYSMNNQFLVQDDEKLQFQAQNAMQMNNRFPIVIGQGVLEDVGDVTMDTM
jgi:hypothetical protein